MMTDSLFASMQDAIALKDQWIGIPTASHYPSEGATDPELYNAILANEL